MSDVNLFLLAAQQKFRFNSIRGAITTEQLFDLPLTSTTGFSLNDVAKTVNEELKLVGEESFVSSNDADRVSREFHSNRLEVVKAVIAVKEEINAKARAASERRARREKVLEALESREATDLAGKSRDELLKELADLD